MSAFQPTDSLHFKSCCLLGAVLTGRMGRPQSWGSRPGGVPPRPDPLTWGRGAITANTACLLPGAVHEPAVPLAPGARHHSTKLEGASASEWDTVRTDGRLVGRPAGRSLRSLEVAPEVLLALVEAARLCGKEACAPGVDFPSYMRAALRLGRQ